MVNALRRATKNILYTVLQSSAMNGVSQYSKVKRVTPGWQKLMYGADVVVGIALVAGTVLAIKRMKKNKKAA